MKTKISPYLIGLAKENLIYLIFNVVLMIVIIFTLSVNSTKIYENNIKITQLKPEVEALDKRVKMIENISLSPQDLDSTMKILASLVPDTEDYFSILYALERLSKKTGFIINSYSINLKSSTKEKLRLTIGGTGDSDSFLKFLSDYNFAGGRLITSDKIELNRQTSGDIKIDLTFYSKKTSIPANQKIQPFSQKMINDLEAIRNKVQFELKDATQEAGKDFSYPRKSNPF